MVLHPKRILLRTKGIKMSFMSLIRDWNQNVLTELQKWLVKWCFKWKGRIHHRIPGCLHSEEWRLRPHRQSVLPEWHWWHLPLPSAPTQTPFSQACWCEWHVGTKCRGVTEESDSPWTSPIILVQKKDGLWTIADWMSQSRAAFYSQGSTTPLTHWQEQIGSLHWTWKLDTGRQHCILKTKRRWCSPLGKHCSSWQSCLSALAMLQWHLNG
jgi:hypothetical protein